MKLFSVRGNAQKLDGGAMYGNAPRALWSRWSPPDAQNRIELACRALLIEDGDLRILVETGIGAYMAPELRERYGVVEEGHLLLSSLEDLGYAPADITHIVLSHLHFDHAGGLLSAYHGGVPPRLIFDRAVYVVGADALARAEFPHFRDRASFIPGLPELLRESGRLHPVHGPLDHPLGPRYRMRFSDGHTPGLMLLEIVEPVHLVFAADLIPGTPWVHLPITMGYDRFPEQLIDEKRRLLEDLDADGGYLFYTHDPRVALSQVAQDPKGRYLAVQERAEIRGWSGQAD